MKKFIIDVGITDDTYTFMINPKSAKEFNLTMDNIPIKQVVLVTPYEIHYTQFMNIFQILLCRRQHEFEADIHFINPVNNKTLYRMGGMNNQIKTYRPFKSDIELLNWFMSEIGAFQILFLERISDGKKLHIDMGYLKRGYRLNINNLPLIDRDYANDTHTLVYVNAKQLLSEYITGKGKRLGIPE